jgi:hypothetical protein
MPSKVEASILALSHEINWPITVASCSFNLLAAIDLKMVQADIDII